MTEIHMTAVNSALADPATAREILSGAQSALEATTAAGIPTDDVEEGFYRGIPGPVWNALKAAIIGAYDEGKSVTIELASGPTYVLDPPGGDADSLVLTLRGPLPER
jgi:hypothetical protein